MRAIHVLLLISPLVSGCMHNRAPIDTGHDSTVTGILHYAKGFTLGDTDDIAVVRVSNPWQQAENVSYQYWLGTTPHVPRNDIPENRYFQVPVKKVVCLSTTFIGFIGFLRQEKTIAGISGSQYVTSPFLAERISHGEVPDVGYDDNLNYERLIMIQPDVVFIYGVSASVASIIARLDEIGIKTVVVAEYLEETPLAKMEWVKFFAAFYDRQEEATMKFDSVASAYLRLAHLASGEKTRPKVLLGLPWSGTWYVSGGKSYMASLVRDAGGQYLWAHLPYKDSQPMNLEKVFEKAYEADFWLNAGEAGSKADILEVDPRFGRLKAFRDDAIYNNNKQLGFGGGNAYYEKGVVEPDIILRDILSVLHPHLLPSYRMKYYRKLD